VTKSGKKIDKGPEPEEGKIKVTDLYDILTDEQKLKNLVSKLKLKAF